MVGREHERAALRRRRDAALAGSGAVVLIAGDSAAGKTRLLGWLAADAAAAGAVVLRGGGFDAAGMPPFLPFVEALGRSARALAPDRRLPLFAPTAPVPAALLAELAPFAAGAGATLPLPPEQERFRLFEAVGDSLAAIAAEVPLLLVLDDLHWADPSTLDLLVAGAAGRLLPRRRPRRRRGGSAGGDRAGGRRQRRLGQDRRRLARSRRPHAPADPGAALGAGRQRRGDHPDRVRHPRPRRAADLPVMSGERCATGAGGCSVPAVNGRTHEDRTLKRPDEDAAYSERPSGCCPTQPGH